MVRHDNDSMYADYATRGLYTKDHQFYWIDRLGLKPGVATMVRYLHRIDSMGFSNKKFRLGQIEADMKRVRQLDFDNQDNRISVVLARLEYNLSKAYLRYSVGQRYGFMNPTYVFNHLDTDSKDSLHTSYRTLYALNTPHANKDFIRLAMHKVSVDSVIPFLQEIEPRHPLYRRLQAILHSDSLSRLGRQRVLVNMERCRWRQIDDPHHHDKYVWVNIPSHHLLAIDDDQTLDMRIAFGSTETKTPLMLSKVKRMDINPQWIMPRSIVKKSILPRLGNDYFFAQHRYFIRDRVHGGVVQPSNVNRQMMESGQYLVIQRGGEGNALGRIIFRFDNNLSIYLHDTSSRSVFDQTARDVSHGCVRVEKPFDLAVFLMEEKDEALIEKIRYSMQADVSSLGIGKDQLTPQMQAVADTLKRSKLIGHVTVKPQIPIFIYYFTLYPNRQGGIDTFGDVYGYDGVVMRLLRNYL